MTEIVNQSSIVFKKGDEKRLEELFTHYSKQVEIYKIKDANSIRFTELMMLLLDKNMFSCRFGMKALLDLFYRTIAT